MTLAAAIAEGLGWDWAPEPGIPSPSEAAASAVAPVLAWITEQVDEYADPEDDVDLHAHLRAFVAAISTTHEGLDDLQDQQPLDENGERK